MKAEFLMVIFPYIYIGVLNLFHRKTQLYKTKPKNKRENLRNEK